MYNVIESNERLGFSTGDRCGKKRSWTRSARPKTRDGLATYPLLVLGQGRWTSSWRTTPELWYRTSRPRSS